MSAATTKTTPEVIACPVCHSVLTAEQLLGHEESARTFDSLLVVGVPLGGLVLQYLSLFCPAKQRLTNGKKLKLVEQLLPSLQRLAITHKGRDWPAPLPAWEKAFEQMQAARAAGRLDLPMTGHGYLFSILAALADKCEAKAEQAQQQALRTRPGTTQAPPIGEVLDPALAEITARSQRAAPMPDSLRELRNRLKGKSVSVSDDTAKGMS